MFILKKLRKLSRVLVVCLVFGSSLSVTSNAGAKGYDSTQTRCIAQNAYHEARGEGEKGMLGTIFVVLNRTKDSRFPSTPCKVISQKNQFVWWGKGKTIKEPKTYDKAKQLVHEVLEGKHKDVTYGAIYFNAHHISPKNSKFTVRIGNHSFFK